MLEYRPTLRKVMENAQKRFKIASTLADIICQTNKQTNCNDPNSNISFQFVFCLLRFPPNYSKKHRGIHMADDVAIDMVHWNRPWIIDSLRIKIKHLENCEMRLLQVIRSMPASHNFGDLSFLFSVIQLSKNRSTSTHQQTCRTKIMSSKMAIFKYL